MEREPSGDGELERTDHGSEPGQVEMWTTRREQLAALVLLVSIGLVAAAFLSAWYQTSSGVRSLQSFVLFLSSAATPYAVALVPLALVLAMGTAGRPATGVGRGVVNVVVVQGVVVAALAAAVLWATVDNGLSASGTSDAAPFPFAQPTPGASYYLSALFLFGPGIVLGLFSAYFAWLAVISWDGDQAAEEAPPSDPEPPGEAAPGQTPDVLDE